MVYEFSFIFYWNALTPYPSLIQQVGSKVANESLKVKDLANALEDRGNASLVAISIITCLIKSSLSEYYIDL